MIYLENNTKTVEIYIPKDDEAIGGGSHGGSYQQGFQDGYASGYTDGVESTEGYEQGYADGFNDGHSSGITDGYSSGYTDGEQHQKSLLSSTAITSNGEHTNANGWSSVTVNVPQGQGYEEGYEAGYAAGHQAGQQYGYEIGYADGVVDGRYQITSTFTSLSVDSNGNYGSVEHPLTAVTVQVPQTGHTYNVETGKTVNIVKNGTTVITPSTASTQYGGHYDSQTSNYYFSASVQNYPQTGYYEIFTVWDVTDEAGGMVHIYVEDGIIGYSENLRQEWPLYEVEKTDTFLYFYIHNANIDFDYDIMSGLNPSYDVMSSVTITVNCPTTAITDQLVGIDCKWAAFDFPLNPLGESFELATATLAFVTDESPYIRLAGGSYSDYDKDIVNGFLMDFSGNYLSGSTSSNSGVVLDVRFWEYELPNSGTAYFNKYSIDKIGFENYSVSGLSGTNFRLSSWHLLGNCVLLNVCSNGQNKCYYPYVDENGKAALKYGDSIIYPTTGEAYPVYLNANTGEYYVHINRKDVIGQS